jgi:hypothetical protein
MSTPKRSERGQALIFIVVGFVIILGFVGLAIDGGKVYSDRRHAQNSADASTLAGGGAAALSMEDSHLTYLQFSCNTGDSRIAAAIQAAKDAAIARATSNGFTIDTDVADWHGVTAACGSDTSLGYVDKYIDVTVKITTVTQPTFASFLFGQGLVSKVEAVTRVRPRMQLALGHAITALNPAGCSGQSNGAGFHGNGAIELWGGGIFSNGCLQADGTPTINTHNGTNDFAGEVGNPQMFSPPPNQVGLVMPIELYYVPPPDCTNRWFTDLTSPLTPGLYCIDGDLTINSELVGDGVTIYMKNGDIKINGNPEIRLKAPAIDADASPAIPGVLIYAPDTNHSTITLNGNSTSNFTGVVYAPGADINMLGTGNLDAYDVQVIGFNVEVGGTADTYVSYCSCQNYTKPTSMDLLR